MRGMHKFGLWTFPNGEGVGVSLFVQGCGQALFQLFQF